NPDGQLQRHEPANRLSVADDHDFTFRGVLFQNFVKTRLHVFERDRFHERFFSMSRRSAYAPALRSEDSASRLNVNQYVPYSLITCRNRGSLRTDSRSRSSIM